MADRDAVLADLAAEGRALEALVAPLPTAAWARPTPAPGWTIAHQIGHLAWTDEVATVAATDRAGFDALLRDATTAGDGFVDEAAWRRAQAPPADLLTDWRSGRARLEAVLRDTDAKLPWFGPPMSATSMATARLMETWAHGQDVADALDVVREPTDRLRNVAHIGVRTRDFAFRGRDLEPPAEPFRVEVIGPGGDTWTWGPAESTQRVSGPALDFCLLVTQRRHRDDLAVTAEGADADRWLGIAQAFAGPPGAGRPAGSTA